MIGVLYWRRVSEKNFISNFFYISGARKQKLSPKSKNDYLHTYKALTADMLMRVYGPKLPPGLHIIKCCGRIFVSILRNIPNISVSFREIFKLSYNYPFYTTQMSFYTICMVYTWLKSVRRCSCDVFLCGRVEEAVSDKLIL